MNTPVLPTSISTLHVMIAQPQSVAVVADFQGTRAVLVSTLGVDEVTEESFANHVEGTTRSKYIPKRNAVALTESMLHVQQKVVMGQARWNVRS